MVQFAVSNRVAVHESIGLIDQPLLSHGNSSMLFHQLLDLPDAVIGSDAELQGDIALQCLHHHLANLHLLQQYFQLCVLVDAIVTKSHRQVLEEFLREEDSLVFRQNPRSFPDHLLQPSEGVQRTDVERDGFATEYSDRYLHDRRL